MKKILCIFAAILIVTFTASAEPKDSLCKCPTPVGTIGKSKNKASGAPRQSVIPTYSSSISNSFNTTTNNYYYPAPYYPPVEVVQKTQPLQPVSTPLSDLVDGFLWGVLFLILVTALILLGILFWKFIQKMKATPLTSKDEKKEVTSHHSVVETKSDPSDLKKDAIEKASAGGGSFSSRADGSWKVDFPKPEVKTDENKQQVPQ